MVYRILLFREEINWMLDLFQGSENNAS